MSFGTCPTCKEYLKLEEFNACHYRVSPDKDNGGYCFKCLYARPAALEAENAALMDTVQILNNRVRFRDGEIQKLRAAMPPIGRLLTIANWFDMNFPKGEVNLNGEDIADMLRQWASQIEAIEKEGEG